MASFQIVHSKSLLPRQAKKKSNQTDIGKCVVFRQGDTFVAGIVKRIDGGNTVVNLAVPHGDGVIATDSEATIPTDLITKSSINIHPGFVREWTESTELKLGEDTKKSVAIMNEDKRVIDYENVIISGYGSTFKDTTPADRVGDYINPGAFDDSIEMFKRNPVMLTDHLSYTECLVGTWNTVFVDSKGLYLEGVVTNAPGYRDLRWKLVEKHIRTLSIGGFFQYAPDGNGVDRVYLYETSIVAIPCNPDATFTVRSVGMERAAKMFSGDKRFSAANRLTI